MVLVDLQVTLGVDSKVHHAVLAYLFKHVVEEAQSCLYVTVAVAVEVDLDVDVGFLGGALDFCSAFAGKQQLGNLGPSHAVASEDKCLASDVPG